MKHNKLILLFLIISGSVLNVSIQSMNWLSLQFLECGYYTLNPACNGAFDLILNKGVRALILWCMMFFIEKFGVKKSEQNFLFPFFMLLILQVFDLFLIFGDSFFKLKLHEFMHPLAYSPVLPVLWLLIRVYFNPSKVQ